MGVFCIAQVPSGLTKAWMTRGGSCTHWQTPPGGGLRCGLEDWGTPPCPPDRTESLCTQLPETTTTQLILIKLFNVLSILSDDGLKRAVYTSNFLLTFQENQTCFILKNITCKQSLKIYKNTHSSIIFSICH